MAVNPYAYYQKTQVETADQGKLLIMLYDGALRYTARARESLNEKDLKGANNSLLRAQAIVAELMASLDLESGELAQSLFRLYDYIHYTLIQANIKKDAAYIDQVEGILVDLRNSWKEALDKEETGKGEQVKRGAY